MQQPPRSVRPQAAPASVPPLTPRKQGEAINDYVRLVENQYRLGLRANDGLKSPIRRITTADRTITKIGYLYYKDESALKSALRSFESAVEFISHEQRLEALYNILKSAGEIQQASGKVTPRSDRHTLSKSRKTPQPSVEGTPRSRGLFDNYKKDAALRAPIADPGSPTDEDEDDFVTPPSPRAFSRSPSPSVTSKSAQRRVEASAHPSLHNASRKRPSDSSNDSGKSPKLTKFSKGKQPFIQPQISSKTTPSLFKKPSLNMARSFNPPTASQSTVATSFNTVSSSQQTQPDTANTSFAPDTEHTEIPHYPMSRTSSTTMGSLDDNDFLTVDAKLVKEAEALKSRAEPSSSSSQGRDSSSTWGSSLPEEELLDASARAESSFALPPSNSRRLSPQQPARHPGGSQPVRSPAKNGSFGIPRSVGMSLNQSFPPPPGVSAILSPDKAGQQSRTHPNSVSPAHIQQRSPREQTPAESPSKIAHHIRDIPRQGLCVEDVLPESHIIPYYILFICQRVALEWSIPLRRLLSEIDIPAASSDPITFWSNLEKHSKASHIKLKESDKVWSAASRQMEGFTFKGQINFSRKTSGPVFTLQLHPIQSDKSCRFQRRFGSDRFLYLNAPILDSPDNRRFNKIEVEQVRDSWVEWINSEHNFLGRRWRVFHDEPMKRAKTKGKKQLVTHDTRIVLFATSGSGIKQPCSVGEMLNWFFCFSRNSMQTFCKAAARFDLGLSRTVPTLIFKPSQVTYVRDIKANGEAEAVEYNDRELYWKAFPPNEVMNDGCSVMSVGAARLIWKLLKRNTGVDGPLPSVFQGRVGGAKGVWMISAESFTKDPDHLDIWIQISDSQLKFEPHDDDLSDDTYDPLRLTFEVLNFSSSPGHSELHIAFIPIMVDRGVPREVIANCMSEQLDADRAELLEVLRDPVKLYHYIHRNSGSSNDRVDIQWQASLPSSLEEKIKFLLESGFSPTKLQNLAKSVEHFINFKQVSQQSTLRAPLGKATYLYGVADPFGVLKPGEVHVQFSTSFVDELASENYLSLRGHDIVIARQPACRRSDIQKAKAIVHPDLSHLVDVVVFPSRGQYPFAGKLQGGDYDGDIFWVCWENRFVEPFKNAPAPVETPNPADYGIRQDQRKLHEVMNPDDLSNVDGYLRESFKFRNQKSLLGYATNFLEKQAYRENCVFSRTLDRICDVHDLLVDALKQGYTFSMQDFQEYLQKTLGLNPKIKLPAYKKVMNDCLKKDSGDGDSKGEKKYHQKDSNVIDYLYFNIVRTHHAATMASIKAILSTAILPDDALLYPHQHATDYDDPVVEKVLRAAQGEMESIYQTWVAGNHPPPPPDLAARLIESCHTRFLTIQPLAAHTDHPLIKSWLDPHLASNICMWDAIRASALYANFRRRPTASTFVFTMAGRELGALKAKSVPGARGIVPQIWGNMKPRVVKGLAGHDRCGRDDSEDEEGVEGAAVIL